MWNGERQTVARSGIRRRRISKTTLTFGVKHDRFYSGELGQTQLLSSGVASFAVAWMVNSLEVRCRFLSAPEINLKNSTKMKKKVLMPEGKETSRIDQSRKECVSVEKGHFRRPRREM